MLDDLDHINYKGVKLYLMDLNDVLINKMITFRGGRSPGIKGHVRASLESQKQARKTYKGGLSRAKGGNVLHVK